MLESGHASVLDLWQIYWGTGGLGGKVGITATACYSSSSVRCMLAELSYYAHITAMLCLATVKQHAVKQF